MYQSTKDTTMKHLSRLVPIYKLGLLLIVVTFLLLLWFRSETRDNTVTVVGNGKHIAKFSNLVLGYDLIRRLCYRGKDPRSMKDFSVFVHMLRTRKHPLCQEQYEHFKSIYQFRANSAVISLSGSLKLRLNETLRVKKSKLEEIKNQTLLFVDNLYTLESVVYNTARVSLPDAPVGDTSKYIKETVDKTREGCDFCNFAKTTAADTFGRMESKSTVIVSNAFKIEKYHGLAILKKHHPLMFTQHDFIDCMHLIMKWFKQVHKISPDDLYRIIYWDLLLKAGISQMHPHMHLTFGNYEYFAKWNELHNAALRFSSKNGHLNYWTRLLQIHTSLGLSARFGEASLMAYLTPKRDYEILVISEKPCLDFFRLIFFTIRSFIDDLHEPSITMGWVFPKLYADTRYGDELPMMFRIVSRGDPMSLQSDISSFDLYGTANINRDPFKAIQRIRSSIKRRTKVRFEFPEWVD